MKRTIHLLPSKKKQQQNFSWSNKKKVFSSLFISAQPFCADFGQWILLHRRFHWIVLMLLSFRVCHLLRPAGHQGRLLGDFFVCCALVRVFIETLNKIKMGKCQKYYFEWKIVEIKDFKLDRVKWSKQLEETYLLMVWKRWFVQCKTFIQIWLRSWLNSYAGLPTFRLWCNLSIGRETNCRIINSVFSSLSPNQAIAEKLGFRRECS